nr:hypothetical protein [Microcystis aeruginosa]
MSKLNLLNNFSDRWFGNLLIEKIRFRTTQSPCFKIAKLVN